MKNSEEFTAHGYYTISNCGGYLVEISPCGEMARLKDNWGSDEPEISPWLEIEYISGENCPECGEDVGQCTCDDGPALQPIIDPTGYNVPMDLVMRI